MLSEETQATRSAAPRKAYQTPVLTTHGSVAKLTQHDSSASSCHPSDGIHHKYRWWEHLF
jgi:hypothetical protein